MKGFNMKDRMIHSIDVARELDVRHNDLKRTILRFSTHGLTDEIKEHLFVNNMGREYQSFLLSERVVNLIEAMFIFQGYGDSKGYIVDYSPKKQPDIVYFIKNFSTGHYKIGCTSSLRNRLQALQIGNADLLEVYATIKGGKDLEGILHKRFESKRINGEWFSITEEDIYDVNIDYKTKFAYHDTLESVIFDLWHKSDNTKELSVADFTDSKNSKVLKALKEAIKDGMERELPYKEIYKFAKNEVETLVDNLCFKRIDR
jgi:phage regulator Rha-like protein